MADDTPSLNFTSPKGGAYGGFFSTTGLEPNVQAVMMNYRWTADAQGAQAAKSLTYYFPTASSDYTTNVNYPEAALLSSFTPLNSFEQKAARAAFDLVSSYTNLTFKAAATGQGSDATFRFAKYSDKGSEANFPTNNGNYNPIDARAAGDIFLGNNGTISTDAFYGTDQFNTIMHEMGHAFGLKHGHDGKYNGALDPSVNDNEFSVMTYSSWMGTPDGALTLARDGSSPQSYMMYDISALQAYYGANFSKVGTTSIYKWDPTGKEWLNGALAPDTGTSSTNKILTTIWTGGATATYDFSNYNENGNYDLRPGKWSTFSSAQLADLNSKADANTTEYQAQGNVYNALLYNKDTRSEISNIVVGNGNDKIMGNDLSNFITLGTGNDTVDGAGGINTVSLSGIKSNYNVNNNNGTITVTALSPISGGIDTLTNIQQIKFADITTVYDLTSANDQSIYLLYKAAFGRMPDNAGFRYWATTADVNKLPILSIAENMVGSNEFTSKYGSNIDNQQYVAELYTNVLGRPADVAGATFWLDNLNNGMGRDQVLVAFAQSPENVSLTGQHMTDGYWTI